MGRPASFRRKLRERGEQYLLAVPSNTIDPRPGDQRPRMWTGHGHPRIRSAGGSLVRSAPGDSLDADRCPRWREGAAGDRDRAASRTGTLRPPSGSGRNPIRDGEHQTDGTCKHDYYLAFAESVTSSTEFARVAKAEHRIEECIRAGQARRRLGDYQVLNWMGWHHHQTLSLVAAWFLSAETRRGKNPDPRR